MNLTTYREVCTDLLKGLEMCQEPRFPFPGYITAAMDRARELLARPVPAEPAEGLINYQDFAELCARHGFHCDDDESVETLHELVQEAIAADRARRHAPTELAVPVNLDALLSPAGPYETGPDAGDADGAQLICAQHGNNPTWWAPVLGSDSLGDLLSRIRSRILPHLRPPILGIDVPGPDGDYGDIVDLCEAEGVGVAAGARLLRRARAAWGQASQHADHIPGPTKMVAPTEGELIDLAGCVQAWAARLDEGTPEERLLGRVAYVLRQRQAPPHEGEVDALIKILSRIAGMLDFMPDGPPDGLVIHRAIELLRQLTPPAEGEAGDLVVWLRSLIGQSVCFESGSENASKLVRAAYLLLTQPHQIAELQRQLNRRTHLNG